MRVYLVRHAEAEPGEPDELRTLSPHGRWQAKELGERFARRGIRPEAVQQLSALLQVSGRPS